VSYYTFVAQYINCGPIYRWLYDEYNATKNYKVLKVDHFQVSGWLENYFLKRNKEIKYAIVGHLSKYQHFQGVTLVKEKDDTCYQMFPTEQAFSPEPFYFTFASAIATSLHKGVLKLQAGGFLQVMQNGKDFREHVLTVYYTRPLIVKYNKEITYKDRKNNKLRENMIALGNISSVVYVALIIVLFANVAFIAEFFLVYRTIIELKVKLWVISGFHILTFIFKVPKKKFKGFKCLFSSSLWLKLRSKRHKTVALSK